MSQPPESLDQVVLTAKVIVCVGPGGVGKTTTSAAIAIHAAYAGRRVIVLTVDPARRLANALGLSSMDAVEQEVPASAFAALGGEPPRGRLTAMMLDVKRTWDEVVARYHPDPERQARLLNNRLYDALSTSLSGSQEYMAMEKLYELASRAEDPPDLIVLDTPPSANAVDFLDAPSRMLDALDNDATHWLIEPFMRGAGRSAGKLMGVGSGLVIRTLGKFTGAETLEQLAELLYCFQAMFDGFRSRARIVRSLLGDSATHFVIVCSPRPGPLTIARKFEKRLHEDKIQLAAFVLNRATIDPFLIDAEVPADEAALRGRMSELGGPSELSDRIVSVADEMRDIAQQERGVIDWLTKSCGDTDVRVVPELERDVHDISALDELRRELFSG